MVRLKVRVGFMVRVSFSDIVVQPEHRYFSCIPVKCEQMNRAVYCSIARANDLAFC